MIYSILAVFLGGGIGSTLRFLCNSAFLRYTHFPWATLVVNLVGSLLIGIFFALAQRQNWSPEFKAFAIAGFLGGLTTFSSFSLDTLKLVMENKIHLAFLNFAANNLMGFVLAYFGFILISKVLN